MAHNPSAASNSEQLLSVGLWYLEGERNKKINSKISCYLTTYVFAGNILHLNNHCNSYATDKHTDCY